MGSLTALLFESLRKSSSDQSPKAEAKGVAAQRRRMLAGVFGRVTEVGAGNGLNFAHYPSSVTEVLAVEPEPYPRERAVRRPPRRLWRFASSTGWPSACRPRRPPSTSASPRLCSARSQIRPSPRRALPRHTTRR